MTFNEWLKQEYGIVSWVVARRTKNIVARYGEDVTCFSQQRYETLEAEYEKANVLERLKTLEEWQTRDHNKIVTLENAVAAMPAVLEIILQRLSDLQQQISDNHSAQTYNTSELSHDIASIRQQLNAEFWRIECELSRLPH